MKSYVIKVFMKDKQTLDKAREVPGEHLTNKSY